MATITDPRGKVTTKIYDIYGRLESTEDAESRLTQFTYDYSNRLLTVIDANNVTAEQRTYTDDGKLYQLTDARSNVSTYTYDGHDRKKRCTYPDSSCEEWTYDAAGNVTTFRSRSGDTITSTFDALNRLSTRTPQGQATETFTYDLAGRLLSASTPTVSGNPATGTFSRGYDSAKRLTSETNPQSQVVSYQLDANGNVTKITYPDSYYVDKVYDQLDRLTNIKLNGSSSSAATLTYDDLSRRTNLTYLNGVEQDYGYDIGDNLTSMDLAWTGSSASWTYGYNDVEEMTSQAFSDTGFQWRPAAAATVSYGTANNLNQYPTVGGVSRTMNSDGCLTGDGTWTYTYDADNMLTQAAKTGVTVDFVYDPFHRNIRKDDGTNKTRYIYAGDQILCEYNDTSGALINRYVYGFEADDPIIQVTSGGTVTYNTQDHVGSIIARTNSSGGILSKYKYAPFGESPSLSGTIFGFTGQRSDAETGLYHFKARYYDPVTGRFLQPDPISYGDGLNLYRYAANNPLGFNDPKGMYYEVTTKPGKKGMIDVNIKIPLTYVDKPKDSVLPDVHKILIEQQWSRKIGKYQVKTTVTLDDSGRNSIQIMGDKTKVKTTGFDFKGRQKYEPMSSFNGIGYWSGQGRPHHEAGHILGIGHGDPKQYPRANLMGKVDEDMEAIMHPLAGGAMRTNYDISVSQIERIIKGSPYPGTYR